MRKAGSLFSIVVLTILPIADSDAEGDTFAEVTERFQPYEPNYAIWQQTDNDADALEARFSFKYLLSDPVATVTDAANRTEWYLKFTGEFDFYWGSRFSSPVINRASNPGAHFRQYMSHDRKLFGLVANYIDIGIEHLSNGQAQDPTLPRNGVTRPQVIYERDPHDPFFDRISRSINFVSIEATFQSEDVEDETTRSGYSCRGINSCYKLSFRLIPYHFDNDNPVTWGPNSRRTTRISDYDRLRMGIAKSIDLGNAGNDASKRGFHELELGLEWTIGDGLLDTDSFDAYVFLPYRFGSNWRLPFYLRYHNGPLNNFSNYTKRQNSVGIGFRLY